MSLQSLNRRRFLASSALGAAALAAPGVLRAQGAPIKVGILQPVSITNVRSAPFATQRK